MPTTNCNVSKIRRLGMFHLNAEMLLLARLWFC